MSTTETNDLIYEGIAMTWHNIFKFRGDLPRETNDLIYEGIAILIFTI